MWSFKIYYNELDSARLQNENSELRGQKRKLEDDLKEERCKIGKIGEKVKRKQRLTLRKLLLNLKDKFRN